MFTEGGCKREDGWLLAYTMCVHVSARARVYVCVCVCTFSGGGAGGLII